MALHSPTPPHDSEKTPVWRRIGDWLVTLARKLPQPCVNMARRVRARYSASPEAESLLSCSTALHSELHGLALMHMPPETLEHMVSHFRRGDLRTLAHLCQSSKLWSTLCSELLYRSMTCRKCDAPLFHPREIVSQKNHVMEDGAFLSLEMAHPPLQHPKIIQRSLDKRRLEPGTYLDDHLTYRLREEYAETHDPDSSLEQKAALQVFQLTCGGCEIYLGEHIVEPQPCGSDRARGVAYLCKNYLRLVDKEGPLEQPRKVCCSGIRGVGKPQGRRSCGQVLFDYADVLSTRHCWAVPGGDHEDAWYINSFAEGSVSVGPSRFMLVAQGRMEVADVSCSACLGVIGWKFTKDLDVREPNRNQVGRFGVCLSSLALAAASEPRVPSDSESSESDALEEDASMEEDTEGEEEDHVLDVDNRFSQW
eukprot:TRINITY_DN81270_c0_g1_i1.p1 TRINITY_DN81270_c0_g1~~TRINITY_DN81270_c0_g1_i1.p1  ORF type:complete len:465 (+),score=53.94 TRINITY_DN81270_c0_g1_i1:132-1397(+)